MVLDKKNINHKELEFLELNIFKISKISRYFETMLPWFFGQNMKILNLRSGFFRDIKIPIPGVFI